MCDDLYKDLHQASLRFTKQFLHKWLSKEVEMKAEYL